METEEGTAETNTESTTETNSGSNTESSSASNNGAENADVAGQVLDGVKDMLGGITDMLSKLPDAIGGVIDAKMKVEDSTPATEAAPKEEPPSESTESEPVDTRNRLQKWFYGNG